MLGWFELPEEDQPPQWIWLDDEKISAHFAGVRERYGSKSGAGMESVPQSESEPNELTASLRRR